MELELVSGYETRREVERLFSEYTDMLIENDSAFKDYLAIQNYEEEVTHLEEKYGPPYGRLYVAQYEKRTAGCIGLRKIDEENCEMKRLYVRPEFRGKHIGDRMIEKIIEDARKIGYRHMFLDTLPFLQSALYLYKRYGFQEVESYNNSPMDTSIYMRLDLETGK